MKTKVYMLALVLLVSMMMPGISSTSAQYDGFNLTVTPFCGYNDLEWDSVPNAAHYWIYRGPGQGQEYATPLTDFPIRETHFRDTINIVNDQLYCYYVRAVDTGANEFAQSIEDCATPTCEEEDDCIRILKYQIDNTMYWVDDVIKGPMEASPVINQARMFLLIRYVAEEVGATVDWVASERKIIITTTDYSVIEIWLGNPTAQVNGQPVQIDPNNPEIVGYVLNGRTVLPMRFVAENLGATGPNDIKWFSDEKMVVLYFDDPECRECKCMTISSVNMDVNPPSAIAVDGSGKTWNLTFEGNAIALAGKLEVGMCYEVCGYPQGGDETIGTPVTAPVFSANVFRVTTIRKVECPCEPEDEPGGGDCTLCVHIERVSGDRAWATDEWGVNWILYRSPNLEAQFVEGSCINVSGNLVEGAVGVPGFEVEQISDGTCCDDIPEQECVCLMITNITAINDNFSVATGYDNTNLQWTLVIPRGVAPGMARGECWEVCGILEEQDDGGDIGTPPPGQGRNMRVETATKKDCCGDQQEECFCVMMGEFDCDVTEPYAFATDNDGNSWKLYLNRKFCSIIEFNECYEVCGTIKEHDGMSTPPPWKEFEVVRLTPKECCNEPEPEPTECQWFTAEIFSAERTGMTDYPWKVSLKVCGGDFSVIGIYNASDDQRVDESGQYRIFDYTGCVKVCVIDKIIKQWIALPLVDNCCGEAEEPEPEPQPQGGVCKGKKIFGTVKNYRPSESDNTNDLLIVQECTDPLNNMGLMITADPNLVDTTGAVVIKDVKPGTCATFCVDLSGSSNVLSVTDWTVSSIGGDCCSNLIPPKVITGLIDNITESGNNYVVWMSECPDMPDIAVNYTVPKGLKDTSGAYDFSNYGVNKCVLLRVKGQRIFSWTALWDVTDCCGIEENGTIKRVGRLDNGDLMITITPCDDEYAVQYKVNPDMRDIHGQMTIEDYTSKYLYCIRVYTYKGRIIAWESMKDAECCERYGYPARIVFDGFYNEARIDNEGAIMTLNYYACAESKMKVRSLKVLPGLRDETGFYTFKTLPTGSCITVVYADDGDILRWTYHKWAGERECCSTGY